MTGPVRAGRRPTWREDDLLEIAAAHLRGEGYTTYLDPDGSSYFDLAARRGEEVGLVEGKVGHPRKVLDQAVRRRAWADWVAVMIDSPRAAARLVERTADVRSAVVGVWSVQEGALLSVRAPRRGVDTPRGADPFAPLRARLREALLAIDRGETPTGVGWSGVPREVRRASGGRSFAEWRLDELVD